MTATLQPLELDFRRRRPASPWGGWVLLAIAVGFGADLGYSYYAARATAAGAEARLARLSGGGRAAPGQRAATPEEIALARETLQRLQLPWDALFGALEAAGSGGQITLSTIEPDTKAGKVTITGAAGSYPAALDYIGRLRKGGVLADAHLVRHELQPNNPQRPVAFTVAAAWGGSAP